MTSDPGGSGGGGRVVVYANVNTFSGTVEALSGTGFLPGSPGQTVILAGVDSLVALDLPLDGATEPVTPAFTWSGLTLGPGQQFVLEVDDDSLFGELTETGEAPLSFAGVSSPFTPPQFLSQTQIFWHIYVTGPSGVEGGSPIKSLAMADADGDGLSDQYEDSQACLDSSTPDATADPDSDTLSSDTVKTEK